MAGISDPLIIHTPKKLRAKINILVIESSCRKSRKKCVDTASSPGLTVSKLVQMSSEICTSTVTVKYCVRLYGIRIPRISVHGKSTACVQYRVLTHLFMTSLGVLQPCGGVLNAYRPHSQAFIRSFSEYSVVFDIKESKKLVILSQ